jgi:uncharacterized Ntn-hydrolase superfamily protein
LEKTDKSITTAEYSKQTGLSVSTITKMLRQGKLVGEKRKGKWAIAISELKNKSAENRNQEAETTGTVFPKSAVSKTKSFTVEQFAQITYLTEQGVQQWLKTGRLSGSTGVNGAWTVEADNLSRPELSHLIR